MIITLVSPKAQTEMADAGTISSTDWPAPKVEIVSPVPETTRVTETPL